MARTNDNRYDRRSGPRDRRLRVGDSERDAVVEILRQRHVEGRLDTDEFQERVERGLRAKTYAELDELVADLPSERAEQGRARSGWRPWPFAFVPLVVIGAVALSGGHLLWPVLPLFLFFFVMRPLAWRARGGTDDGRGFRTCGPRYTAARGPDGEF